MTLLSDALDAIVEVSTSSAEIVATKWQAIAVTVLAIIVLLVLAVLLVTSPLAGLALGAIILAAIYLWDGDIG